MSSETNARAFQSQVQQALVAHARNRLPRTYPLPRPQVSAEEESLFYVMGIDHLKVESNEFKGDAVQDLQSVSVNPEMRRTLANFKSELIYSDVGYNIIDEILPKQSVKAFWNPTSISNCSGMSLVTYLKDSDRMVLILNDGNQDQLVILDHESCDDSKLMYGERCFCGWLVYISILFTRETEFAPDADSTDGIRVVYNFLDIYTRPDGTHRFMNKNGMGQLEIYTGVTAETLQSDDNFIWDEYYYIVYESTNSRGINLGSGTGFERYYVSTSCNDMAYGFGYIVALAFSDYFSTNYDTEGIGYWLSWLGDYMGYIR